MSNSVASTALRTFPGNRAQQSIEKSSLYDSLHSIDEQNFTKGGSAKESDWRSLRHSASVS